MKKLFALILAAMLLLAFFAACNAPPEAIETTTEAPAEPLRPNPLGFDPNNPEDLASNNETIWLEWMEANNLLITADDYRFGEFYLPHMPFEEAQQHFPSAPLSERVEDFSNEFHTAKTWLFDSLELMFVSEDDSPLYLYSIISTDPGLVTPRGLRVGDSAEKVYALYGIPQYVTGNQWSFGDGFYDRFGVILENGIVQSIRVNTVM